VSINALIEQVEREKKTEIAFFTIFSVLIFVIFYFLISMNGLVLGNDPAVHLEKAQIFLQTGKIPLVNLGWTPPLYSIMLAIFIYFTGATDIGQLIFLVKALAVIIDWLMFMTVYLLGSRFFNKKVGALAAVLLLMCFPMFEVNLWGGYTSVLGIAFMFLLLLYLPLSHEKFGYLIVTFFAAFSIVLSHQLATFVAALVLPPVMLFMLIKGKGASLKVILVLMIGGGIAFALYYLQAMMGYLDMIIEHVFFTQKTYAYQIPATSLESFMINFGFIFLVAFGGLFVAFKVLRAAKKPIFYAILLVSFVVPLILAWSYVFGLYLPFQWFIYYVLTPTVVLAAVFLVFIADKAATLYAKSRASLRRNWIKIGVIGLIVLMSGVIVLRSSTVYGKIMEGSVYYSTSDIKAFDAGIWLRDHYPDSRNCVVTEVPGFWFQEYSGKPVIAQTDLTVQRNEIAESVLSLSYEIEHPQTLVKAYEAKGAISDENYVSLDHIWNRVSYCSGAGNQLLYTQDGVDFKVWLSSLSKQVVFDDKSFPKKIQFIYSNENFTVTQTALVENNTYPVTVAWTLKPLRSEISNAALYLSTFFDLKFTFSKAHIPQVLDWVNPWDAPEYLRTTHGSEWAVATFNGSNVAGSYLGLYDDTNDIAFAFRFVDLPEWGNIGALPNRQIDAVRFQYEFDDLSVNETGVCSYQVLTMSKNSFPSLSPEGLESMFELKTPAFTVPSRDFRDYIAQYDIGFIVYDKNQLDTKMIHSKLLQLIYSNDRYVIFKIAK